MNAKLFALFSLVTLSLMAEDAPAPPTKKEIAQNIPHVWLAEGLVCLKARENSLSFANQAKDISTTSDFTKGSTTQPKFDWDSGLRIEMGFQPNKQYFFANWTYIQNVAHSIKSTDGTKGFFPILSMDKTLLPSSYVTSGNVNWKLNTQLFDIGAIFPWQPSSFFLLKVPAGARIVSLNQKLTADYGGGVFDGGMDSLTMRNNFLGIGPRLGLAPNILLPKGFSLIGEFAASALLGRFYVSQKEQYLSHKTFDSTNVTARMRYSLDSKAALAWQKELFYKVLVISAQAGWEWHEFFDQNELSQNAFHLPENNDNLFLQGGFISLCLAF